MAHLALLLALVLPQFGRPSEIGELERIATSELRLPKGTLATQLLTLGDVDGSGADDLVLVRVQKRDCGMSPLLGALDLLSSARFPILRAQGVRGGAILDRGTSLGEAVLLRVHREPWDDTPAVELRTLDDRNRLWSLPTDSSPIGAVYTGCLLPAASPDAACGVIVANAWARQEDQGTANVSGAVARLSAVDGSTEWVHWASDPSALFGTFLAAAGDVDGDGVHDLAVCLPDMRPTFPDAELRAPHLEFLSGADGTRIGTRALEPAGVRTFRGIGDLDGDGRVEFVVQSSQVARDDGPPTWLLLSGRAEPVAVFPDHEVLWFVPWRALDGRAELLMGVRNRTDDARSLQLVNGEGTRRLADCPEEHSARIFHAESGDFDGDGLTDLAVVRREAQRGRGWRETLVVLPGTSLR
ncbi:MAG TPA: hypothetical protein VMT18_00550 [Planctomycetota bacterium]|nr:hypothetical protein [Planctomycetota bacterium]